MLVIQELLGGKQKVIKRKDNMSNKLKNIALILVGVLILLLAVDYTSYKLSNYMTEYNSVGINTYQKLQQ